jgi:transcriptional regulator CtsR
MNKLQKIVDYFNDHMKEIEQFIKDLIQQEQKKNDEIKREQSNQLDSLQKQL